MNPRRFLLLTLMVMSSLITTSIVSASETRSAGSSGLLLVANKGDRTLSIVEPESGQVLGAVPEEGTTGHEVAASPDGKLAFVPIYGSSGVGHPGTDGQLLRVIDLAAKKIVGTVDFGKGLRPHCAVVGPKDGLLYVTTELDDSVTVIDPVALKVLRTIPTGQHESHMLAISPDGSRGYTANVGPGTVSVIDLHNAKVLSIIPISKETQRISISPDGRWVFTSDQTKPQLAVIDTSNNQIKTWVPLPASGYGTAPTPDGRWLLVALPGSNQVAVIDLSSFKLARSISVPRSPQEVLIQPDGSSAYVSCSASAKVAVIDLHNWSVSKLIGTGPGTDGLAWANPK